MMNRNMTRDAMANLLCDALRIIDSHRQELKGVEEEMTCALDQSADTTIQVEEEIERLKAKSATEVVDLQRDVLDLQRQLLAEKDRQLDDLRASVESVKLTVETEMKSYSSALKSTVKSEMESYSSAVTKSCSNALAPKKLQSVVQRVAEKKERSENVIIYGLKEEQDEHLQSKVASVLAEIGEKPILKDCYVVGSV